MENRRINVLHIRDSGGLYGAEQVILSIGRLINRERFCFSLVCLDRGDGNSEKLGQRAKKLGIQVTMIPDKRGLDLKAISSIRRHVFQEKIDICHSHDTKSNFYSFLASKQSKVKLVATAHGSTRDSLKKRAYLYIDEKFTYKYFDKIIAVSGDLKDQLIRLKLDPGKIVVIRNGIDENLIDIFADEGNSESRVEIPKKEKMLGIVGRLYPDKGHEFFLQAFSNVLKLYPDTGCMIVGDGPERTRIQDKIRALDLEDAVILCGARKNMKEIYDMIDFLVIPSKREGLPYSLLEAMIRKIPVVSTPVGDIPLLIKEDVSGSLVKFGDIQRMTEAISRMLTDPYRCKQMTAAAYETVMTTYTANKMVLMTEQMYRGLISPRPE